MLQLQKNFQTFYTFDILNVEIETVKVNILLNKYKD